MKDSFSYSYSCLNVPYISDHRDIGEVLTCLTLCELSLSCDQQHVKHQESTKRERAQGEAAKPFHTSHRSHRSSTPTAVRDLELLVGQIYPHPARHIITGGWGLHDLDRDLSDDLSNY